jgi:putative transposase
MGFLKGKIAIQIFKRFPHMGRKYGGRHFWSRGYCVSTVGIDEEQIRQYVKWQEKQEKQLEAIQGKLFD